MTPFQHSQFVVANLQTSESKQEKPISLAVTLIKWKTARVFFGKKTTQVPSKLGVAIQSPSYLRHMVDGSEMIQSEYEPKQATFFFTAHVAYRHVLLKWVLHHSFTKLVEPPSPFEISFVSLSLWKLAVLPNKVLWPCFATTRRFRWPHL